MLGLLIKSLLFERRAGPPDRCQEQAQVAVVVQTVLRPSLERAIKSVFDQKFSGRIHLLIGVDKRVGKVAILDRILASGPPNVSVTTFDPGYSTSTRHGGVHSNHFGGAIRTILSFAANSPYVAYLDDDDWYNADHLSSLLDAIQGKQWAFSHRWYVNPYTIEPMCVDTLENLGPGAGIYINWGGFACPSSLLIDKRACAPILHAWAEAGTPQGDGEDRRFFKALSDNFKLYGATNRATVNCVIKPEDGNHPIREKIIIESGYPIERLRGTQAHGFERPH
jgi:hypothetical protein